MLAHPLERNALPIGKALGAVDAENVRPRLDERRHALGVIAGVDARAHQVALVRVEHLERVGLVGIVVLAKYHVHEMVFGIDQRKRVELVVPDDVVSGLEARIGRRHDHALARGHEVDDLLGGVHAGDAVIATRYDAEQLAVGRTVVSDGHRGMAVLFLEGKYVGERRRGSKVRIARHETGFVILDASDHGRLALDGLRAVDEREAALGGERDGHAVIGHGLHDGRHHRDVERDRRLFALLVLHEGSLQTHLCGNAL